MAEGRPSELYLSTAAEIARAAGRKYAFGPYTPEDIEQTAWAHVLESWPKYDESKRPGPFINRIVKNHLHNLYRDECHRSDPPCHACHRGDENAHPDGLPCKAYVNWARLNKAKASLLCPGDLDDSPAESEQALSRRPVSDEASDNELSKLIDTFLPAPLRADYVRLLGGQKLRTKRRAEIRKAVEQILKEHAPSVLQNRGRAR